MSSTGTSTPAGADVVGQLLDDQEPDTILTFFSDGITFHRTTSPSAPLGNRGLGTFRRLRGRLLYARPTFEHLARFSRFYKQ